MATAKAQNSSLVSKVTRPFTRLARFFKDVYSELQRVVWPTHEETYSFTVVVIIAMVIVGLWVGVLDFLFTWIGERLGIAG